MITALIAQLGTGVTTGALTPTPATIGKLIINMFSYAILAGAFIMMYYMLMGAIHWIGSEGDKEKLVKAQKSITNAIIGFIILMSLWSLFFLITSDILGIFGKDAAGNIKFELPSLF